MPSPKGETSALTTYDVLIIGAGHNGLVCAAYLGMAGLKVKVVERRAVVGGAAVTEEFHPGFRNSVAAYTVSLLNPKVIRDLDLHGHGLKIVERRALNFLPTEDGRYLLTGEGRTQARDREIQRAGRGELRRLQRRARTPSPTCCAIWCWSSRPIWCRAGTRAACARRLRLAFVGKRLRKLDIERQRALLDLFAKSAADYLDGWFESDPIKAVLGFDAVVGNYASPYTPGSAYVLLHHCFGEVNGKKGIWGHAIGGMGAITQAMAKSARAHGADIETRAGVREVIVEKGRAAGVVLDDGRSHPRARRRLQRQSEAALRAARSRTARCRRLPRAHEALEMRLRHLPHECRAVGIAELHRPARPRDGRPPHRRHHPRAVARLYGPRL